MAGYRYVLATRFHSISFPNEWGVEKSSRQLLPNLVVSIQLVSPTSGQIHFFNGKSDDKRFPFN